MLRVGEGAKDTMQVLDQALKTVAAGARPILRQYQLVERVRRYNPHTDEALLNRAYVYAMKAHGAQRRA